MFIVATFNLNETLQAIYHTWMWFVWNKILIAQNIYKKFAKQLNFDIKISPIY